MHPRVPLAFLATGGTTSSWSSTKTPRFFSAKLLCSPQPMLVLGIVPSQVQDPYWPSLSFSPPNFQPIKVPLDDSTTFWFINCFPTVLFHQKTCWGSLSFNCLSLEGRENLSCFSLHAFLANHILVSQSEILCWGVLWRYCEHGISPVLHISYFKERTLFSFSVVIIVENIKYLKLLFVDCILISILKT